MIRTALVALFLALAGPATAAAWQAGPGSTLGFTATAQGESFEGQFQRFEADIHFAPDNLAGARFDVRIETGSADTQNAERDELLPAPAFFDSTNHPQARYRAAAFEAIGGSRFRALGELELRGIRHPVPLEFSWLPGADGTVVLEGRAQLSRLAFEVGGGDWADTDTIADGVEVRTRLLLVPAD